jgi:hypothetical protein
VLHDKLTAYYAAMQAVPALRCVPAEGFMSTGVLNARG